MEAGAQDGTQAMTVIERHPLEADARARAATLVTHGIGAAVDHPDDASPEGAYAVTVLPNDALRARQILGVEPPPDDEEDWDADELVRSSRPWLIPVLVLAAVFVVVPLAAFFITYKLQGG